MTISEVEVKELVQSASKPRVSGEAPVAETAVSREAAERMLRYLLFHRSLIGESEGTGEVLHRYMSLVQNLKEGVHVVITDPFQKATALLFELVLEEEFDPWEIDLVRFTQLYLERVRENSLIDFAVAGRLVYMAWSILYLQSKEILSHREALETPPDNGNGSLDDASYLGDFTTPEQVEVTTSVLEGVDGPPLEQMVRHTETRPVSLLELVQAFGEAEETARRQLRVQELRERLQAEQRAPPEVLVHGDVPESDLTDLWTLALGHPIGTPFPLIDCWKTADGRDRLVALFLAALFLAKENVVVLRQANLVSAVLEVIRQSAVRQNPREN